MTSSYREKQGFTVFLTGIPAAGKSPIASFLRVRLMEIGARSVHLLDGEILRKSLSSDPGFLGKTERAHAPNR